MNSAWSWISSVCRQKRILILLCTFGSSFIVFNYSLLSSTTTNAALNSYTTNKLINDDNKFNGALQQRHEKLSKIQKHPVSSASFTLNSALSQTTRIKSNAAKHTTASSTLRNKESIMANQWKASLLSQSVSKHANKSFTSQHREASKQVIVPMINKHSYNSKKNRVNFPSAIEQKDDNNNILMSSNLEEANNDSISSENTRSNRDKPFDTTGKTDEIRQPTVASSSITPTEITGASIIISSSSSQSGGKNENVNGAVTENFIPILLSSNSIQSSLIQPSSSSRLFSPATTTRTLPLQSSSFQPQRLTSFHTSSGGGGSNGNNNSYPFSSSLPITSSSKSNLPSPFHIPPCNTTFQLRRIQKRKKNLTVIENFIMGWQHVRCNETITYTTHGDYRYLDNLVPLADRWNGPVSLAVYCPGDDLDESLKLISYLKLCTSSSIDRWVTFHLLYDTKFLKRPVRNYTKHGDIPWLDTLYQQGKWKDCSLKPTFSKSNHTFRIRNGLLYPINIARNIARAAATTYFVLASDIELYPSINLIPSFMEMLGRLEKEEKKKSNYAKKSKFTAAAAAVMAKILFSGSSPAESNRSNDDDGGGGDEIADPNRQTLSALKQHQNEQHQSPRRLSAPRHVFVLPVFEVKKEIVPCQVETKEQLASLLKHRAAVLFHHSICPQCHTFPKFEEWKTLYPNMDSGAMKDFRKYNCSSNNNSEKTTVTLQPPSPSSFMRIFHKAKRKHPYQLWEPIFIGTKEEPIYDERLSWEGLRDKMVSGYIMCALDYDFYILDNAFLVHKPGIRKVNHLVTKTVMSQDRLINYRIRTELLKRFGKHDECAL